MICLAETSLKSSGDSDNLLISGYILFRADHADNVRRSMVVVDLERTTETMLPEVGEVTCTYNREEPYFL